MHSVAARLYRITRTLLRAPLFTLVAIVTLAVGIGANTAMFSVVYAVLLKPLPFEEPDRLVGVWHKAPGLGPGALNQCPAFNYTYDEEGRAFERVGMWNYQGAAVTGRGEPERVRAVAVTYGVLDAMRIQPARGRRFTRHDDSPAGASTVMLTHAYWQRKFGGDPAAVGQSVIVDGTPRQIIGVLPASFRYFPAETALLVPVRLNRAEVRQGEFSYTGIARLKPGVTIEQANADVARMIPMSMDKFPMPTGFTRDMFEQIRIAPNVHPLANDVIGDVGAVLWLLLGTVGVVLLIACANVANLFLVRAESRQRELAVRVALGARWTQIARELLSESLLLGLAGGLVGTGLAYAGIRLLVWLAPDGLPRLDEIALNPIVLLFTLAISLAAGLLFGLAPLLKFARPNVTSALKEGGRGSSDGRDRHRMRNALVVAEVALALVLLVGSGLMIRTFQALRRVEPGFTKPEEVVTLRIAIPETVVRDEVQAVRTYDAIAQRIAHLPGVRSVGLTSSVTMDGFDTNNPAFVEQFPVPAGRMAPIRRYKSIGERYFETLGNRIVAGRALTWADTYNQTNAVMVNEAFAREYWKTAAAAIGKRMREAPNSPWREIVGVAGDERDDGVAKPVPAAVYWPLIVRNYFGMDIRAARTLSYVIRSDRMRSATFLKEIQQAVWSVNSALPLSTIRSLDEIRAQSMAQTSFALVMLAIAGSVALLLGIVGIYGVIACVASQRTRELGIRLALGAQHGDVSRLLVRHALVLTAIGVALGLAGAFAATRFMSALLFGVTAMDPLTYAAVAVGLALVAMAASYLPARRASRVDPVTALRAEA